MSSYILRRLALMIPTLFGIMLVNFVIIQAAPGGPVEQMIAKLEGFEVNAISRIGGSGNAEVQQMSLDESGEYRGRRGLDPELIKDIEQLYGFDKPAHERFVQMIKNYLTFDFGDSFFRDAKVVDLIMEKLPVSISLGLWSTLIIYLISIPLGIRKALKHGSRFDIWSSAVITTGYAIPSFLLAILLIVLFAGGSYWNVFPLRGLVSDNFDELSFMGQIQDYIWHMILPIICMVISGFATLTMLTKNSFLDEIHKQYVQTARAKGLDDRKVLYGHIFRNAMLLVISGFPAALIGILFTSSLLIEIIFSLDGLGLLGYEAAINRDYPVVFGSLYIFTLLGMLIKLLGDLTYVVVDPRIDFEARD
ncbi:microcin C ABC transporter permease YejB [Endozoicomonas sp. GU-1]|uniref:microcin C ABC transporter permease YejB n=1 Tax=Endozoicomonas sp. GU-1 TaxID=3009078 RepID=UPI0022B2F694|nr:microcin C ABC transporter permease YejB [Endozoicomonas sp. GU-1]WBA79408.1 microcin C ABC transporter permease YejB [Endozoicomonas sp. GU-1]WBA87052.1 microcin C ABC transporter permease YejB [Endozoicomonas sp. GU-1]